MTRRFSATLSVLISLAVLSGCANYLAPFETQEVRPGTTTPHTDELRNLPAPEEMVYAAVYRFRDQTGQYKLTNVGSTFSTAVTQGATSILVRALDESGWFIPIEREGLSNLLNERQIIQTTRAQNSTAENPAPGLPPLLFAGVLVEGGIVGYDTNVMTGGLGARYLGMGASGQFRQDQVTVYLRAVSTQTGRVLKTVHATKTILSQQLEASVFRYVDANRILEAEAGYTFNEPSVVAVTQAIEEAVIGLVLEGVRDQLWSLADPGMVDHEAFAAYDARVSDAQQRDVFGRALAPRHKPIAVSLSGGAQLVSSDYADPLVRPAGSIELRFRLSQRFDLGLSFTGGGLAADRAFNRLHGGGDLLLRYTMLPRSSLSPFLTLGSGALLLVDSGIDPVQTLVPTLGASAGFELALAPQAGFTISLGQTYALMDALDDIDRGSYNDNIWTLRTGITFYSR